MADAQVLGTCGAIHEGSSPSVPTTSSPTNNNVLTIAVATILLQPDEGTWWCTYNDGYTRGAGWRSTRSTALRQYEECERVLDQELGVKPEAKTSELFEAIKTRRLATPFLAGTSSAFGVRHSEASAQELKTQTSKRRTQSSNLPAPATDFVGRQRELADIIRRFTDPTCRLLTLAGPGGIGKTQLALQVARTITDGWGDDDAIADGVLFVPLAAVDTFSGLVSALAAAAQFDFYPNVPPHQQMLDYFRARRMLVVLDNFEQLLDAAGFCGELLTAAPHLRLLVTSRVALNLREEWFHPIAGLSFPAEGDEISGVAQLARFDAVRLFEQSARRIRGDFTLSRERAQVVRLCQIVEGMPLAIELAASWLKVLSVDQVVAALERDLDILTTRDRNIPERHRSMRAVLEESWRLLSAEEQQILAGLAVFCAGFSAEAAAAVVGASLAVLATLVEKSLLRTAADGRFQLHELLRQFAAEQLAADAHAGRTAHALHSAFYLAFLAEREARLLGQDQRAAVAEIASEAENVRAAWLWAIEHQDLATIDRALYSCFVYYFMQSYFQEGDEIFSRASAISAHAGDPLYARVRARAFIRGGAFRYLLGDYESAMDYVEHGLAAAQALGLQSDVACARLTQGGIAGWRGDAATARQWLNEGLAIGRAIGDTYVLADALHELARICGSYGTYAEGKRLAQESLAISRACGLADWAAHALRTLAWSTVCCGEYHEAEAYFRESLALSEQIGSQFGVAESLGGIGWVAWCVGGSRLQEAREYIERSLCTVRTLGHRLSVANYLGDLALIAIDSGDYWQAWAYGQEGLALARELDSAIYIAYHLCILGHVASARQEFETSRRYLGEALRTTSESRLWPKQAFTLYHMAVLLRREAACAGDGHPTAVAQKARALELLASIADHPVTWHVYQVRSSRLIDELRRNLPVDQVEAAIARGQQLDWQGGIAPLLDELARPLPMPAVASAA